MRYVLAVAALYTGVAVGQELPKDAKEMKTLTVEQAKKLAKVTRSYLDLDRRVTKLDAETARELSWYQGDRLSLNGLVSLDADAAEALAESRVNHLSLNGLSSLDADVAEALAEFQGDFLSLEGLTSLDPDAAEALAEFQGDFLTLDGLKSLTSQALAARLVGHLSLTEMQLETVSAEVAAILIQHNEARCLEYLTTIDLDTAKAVVQNRTKEVLFFHGELLLNGLTKLDADAAKALSSDRGVHLSLNGLVRLDPDTAGELSWYAGDRLSLDGLTAVDADTAEALAHFRGAILSLNGLTSLDADAARALATFQGNGKSSCLLVGKRAKLSKETFATLRENPRIRFR